MLAFNKGKRILNGCYRFFLSRLCRFGQAIRCSPRRVQRFAKVIKFVDDKISVIIPQFFKPIVLD
jgi:hypothetical protein